MTVETFDISKNAESIVTVSSSAAEHFRQQIAKNSNLGIRLSLKQAGCTGYKYSVEEVNEREDKDLDLVLENGVHLFVDSQFLAALQGTEIDVRQQGLNLNLVLENPNVKDECGCGESFSIQE